MSAKINLKWGHLTVWSLIKKFTHVNHKNSQLSFTLFCTLQVWQYFTFFEVMVTLLHISQVSHSLLKHFTSSCSRDVYLCCCKGGVELKGQVSCSNSNSSCGLGRLQKFTWDHSRSGHTKHVEGKYWLFTRWHFYDPLESEAKEDPITFFCYDIEKGQTIYHHWKCCKTSFTSKSLCVLSKAQLRVSYLNCSDILREDWDEGLFPFILITVSHHVSIFCC